MIIITLSKLKQSLYQSPINISLTIKENTALIYVTNEMFLYLSNKYKELQKENKKLYIRIEDELYEIFICEINQSKTINEDGIINITSNESVSFIKVEDLHPNFQHKIIDGKYL